MSRIDPWKRIGIPAAEMLEGIRSDDVRQTWVCEDRAGIAGIVSYRTRCAWDVLNLRGAGDILRNEFGSAAVPEAGYVHALAVFPGHEGAGIGKVLLDHAEGAVTAECSLILLFVTDFNIRARAFYERNGYRFLGAVENCLRAGNTENLMMKQLR